MEPPSNNSIGCNLNLVTVYAQKKTHLGQVILLRMAAYPMNPAMQNIFASGLTSDEFGLGFLLIY
jgi:hypothetical protein